MVALQGMSALWRKPPCFLHWANCTALLCCFRPRSVRQKGRRQPPTRPRRPPMRLQHQPVTRSRQARQRLLWRPRRQALPRKPRRSPRRPAPGRRRCWTHTGAPPRALGSGECVQRWGSRSGDMLLVSNAGPKTLGCQQAGAANPYEACSFCSPHGACLINCLGMITIGLDLKMWLHSCIYLEEIRGLMQVGRRAERRAAGARDRCGDGAAAAPPCVGRRLRAAGARARARAAGPGVHRAGRAAAAHAPDRAPQHRAQGARGLSRSLLLVWVGQALLHCAAAALLLRK